MTSQAYAPPAPRDAVEAPGLSRPAWTTGVPRDRRLLWLDKNENADPELGAVVRRVLLEVGPDALSTYPEPGPLYRKLAAALDLTADHLVLTAGSDGAIRSVFEAYISPGDIVVHSSPTFAMYPVYCAMYGAKPVLLEYQTTIEGPQLDVDGVVANVGCTRPKLVCLPNPDSPTGTVFRPDELRRIVEAAGEAGALMLVDEAYHPFYEPTALPWVKEYEHLVVARTFAKAWGLAGLRIGYAAATPAVAHVLHQVRSMYEVNTVAVAVMERMLDHRDEMLASVRRLNAGRDGFLAVMRALGLRTLPGHGNFLHVAFGAHAPAVHAALSDMVLYRRDSREPCLAGFSRFSSTTAELFRPVIERIREVVGGSPRA